MFYASKSTRNDYGEYAYIGIYILLIALLITIIGVFGSGSLRYIVVDENTNTSIRMRDRPWNSTIPLRDRPWTNWYFAFLYEETEPPYYFFFDWVIGIMALFGYLGVAGGTLFYCCSTDNKSRQSRTGLNYIARR